MTDKMNITPSGDNLEILKESLDFLNKQNQHYREFFFKYYSLKMKQKEAYNKYKKSEKGKEAVKRAKANYYKKVKEKKNKLKNTIESETIQEESINIHPELDDDFFTHFYGS
jgi:uncharacterized protein YdiU (UPF0061 family)